MASDVIVTFKLDPFYQTFLRNMFDKHETLFAFDKRSDFNALLNLIVQKPPSEYIPEDFGDQSFRVRLPYFEDKDVFSFNYISPAGNRIFKTKVEETFKIVFHSFVTQAIHRNGIRKKDAIHLFMDQYGLIDFNSDRLFKGYQRYEARLLSEYNRFKSAQRQAKYRKKK